MPVSRIGTMRGKASKVEQSPKVPCQVPLDLHRYGHWMTTTVVAALGPDGIIVNRISDGPMNGDSFRAWISGFVESLRPGDIVVCDNLKAVAAGFLRDPISRVPYRIHTILTENCMQFANHKSSGNASVHAFDRIFLDNGIEHRLTKVNHPWTNGQVERMNPS